MKQNHEKSLPKQKKNCKNMTPDSTTTCSATSWSSGSRAPPSTIKLEYAAPLPASLNITSRDWNIITNNSEAQKICNLKVKFAKKQRKVVQRFNLWTIQLKEISKILILFKLAVNSKSKQKRQVKLILRAYKYYQR
jgi:hypothetical protein